MRMCTASRRTALPVLAGLALLAPATATAKSTEPLRSVSAPPEEVIAGGSFDVSARVLNTARRATRPQVVIRLRKYKYAHGGRVLVAKRLGKVAAGQRRRFDLDVDLPASVAPGRYWLSTCVTARAGRSCELSDRRLTVLARTTAPAPRPAPGPQPEEAAPPPPRYDVLAFTEAIGETHSSVSDAVDALRDIGRRERFRVTVASTSSGVFTETNLERYRSVVFLNTAGDVLNDTEQAAFESYFKDGGGFLGIHSAIATETGWPFMNDLLGTRATGAAAALDGATIKVADRVHDASKSLPEYWNHEDEYYNFTSNVRGFSHVLATVDETTYAGGAMGFDHPVMWCKDYEGGRSFYSALGHTRSSYRSSNFREHLAGAVAWTAGVSDPTYSDCGATVLANFQQVKITAPPNLNEPIGFDQLPDGRIIQTTRDGRVRLHDPESGSVDVIASLPVYTHSEDGLYGPAVDNNFATNRWVYLYYSPLQMDGTAESGKPYPATTPPGNAPVMAADPATFDEWMGYFQLSRFKFREAAGGQPAHLDLDTEQKIMRVEVDRGACCHVAGDIDFDSDNNLWLVTGDDTPAGSVNVQQFPPFNDMKTNENQTISPANATGGTFTLTFDGQTTAPIAFPFDNADLEAKLEALSNIDDVFVSNSGANRAIGFAGRWSQDDVPLMTAAATGLTGPGPAAPSMTVATTQEANWFLAPHNDARRGATNTNDLRGKLLRIKVNADGSYAIPDGNLFPEGMAKTRPEIYAMGFRNPFRVQVDSDDVAYVTDYSPDSRAPTNFRGPAGTGRVEVVREPSNYGWPMCYGPQLPMYQWDFNTQVTFGEPFDCDNPTKGPANTSRWNTGLRHGPPITQPDIWYSYNDNATPPQGTPCLAYYDGSGGTCPQLFPELGVGGVGPHGADAYEFDPASTSETKFPPYYDGAMILGEFTRDYLREVRFDSKGGIQKINNTLNCGAFGSPTNPAVPFECDNPMDMQFGADGNLYLLTYGDGFFVANPDAGLYRFEYTAGSQRPKAVMDATPTNGAAPLTVQFSSEGSMDPDEGDSIRFDWDFGVPGTDADRSMDPNPSYTYTTPGVYTARLTVTDSSGKTQSRTIPITVGNTAPTVTITTPVDGDFFEFGDSIPYTVTVTDPEDASIDCSRVQVTFVLVHDQHGHAEAGQTGCSGVLPTLAGDAAHGGYLGGGINASYTDTGGAGSTPPLTTTKQHVVQLRRQHVEYVQEAAGIQFSSVAAPETDPLGGGQAANQIDNGDWLALNNRYSFDNMDKQITFRFANNQAAGTLRGLVDVRLDTVGGPVIATCELRSTGNNGVYTSQTCPFTGTVTGSHRVYLTFRQATGGPATGFGLLNWVEFSGAGL